MRTMYCDVIDRMRRLALASCLLLLTGSLWAVDTPRTDTQAINSQALNIQVKGLFKNGAILNIDGVQRMLRVGKRSPEGVLLIEADSKQAIIEIDGQRQQLGLSRLIGSNFKPVTKREVTIRRNEINQYITNALINGRRLPVLVDTGANTVAMSSVTADSLGINYRQGRQAMVSTASGTAPSFMVKLQSIKIGSISVLAVEAVVIVGAFPQTVLLGMSFLEHVDMRETNGILHLQGKF